MLPGTPPTTLLGTATGGGASSSFIILTLVGILLGVRSSPFVISLMTFTTLAAGAAGACGAGVVVAFLETCCCLGSTSVNHNGIRIRKLRNPHCSSNEISFANVLRLRCPLLASSRLSSNRAFSPPRKQRRQRLRTLYLRLILRAQQLHAYSCAFLRPRAIRIAHINEQTACQSGKLLSSYFILRRRRSIRCISGHFRAVPQSGQAGSHLALLSRVAG
jgi:hypothetical protein